LGSAFLVDYRDTLGLALDETEMFLMRQYIS
jgi:hypothetical protein